MLGGNDDWIPHYYDVYYYKLFLCGEKIGGVKVARACQFYLNCARVTHTVLVRTVLYTNTVSTVMSQNIEK